MVIIILLDHLIMYKTNWNKPRNYNYEQERKPLQRNRISTIIAETKADAVLNNKKVHWFFSYVCNGKFAVF